MTYNPANWYWSGAPGVYGSARGGLVTAPTTDAAYLLWQRIFNGVPTIFATAWPKDATGAVTTAALDAVLTTASPPQPATGLTPPTPAILLAYVMSKVTTLLAASRSYTVVGVTGTISCDSGPSASTVSEALQWGSASPAPTGTLSWVDNNYAVFSLTAAEAVAFASAVGAYKISVYAVSGPAVAQITAGTITATAQIDSLTWPV